MVFFRLISFLRKNLDGANVEIINNKNNLFVKKKQKKSVKIEN
jgi:hypothetical protein